MQTAKRVQRLMAQRARLLREVQGLLDYGTPTQIATKTKKLAKVRKNLAKLAL